MKLAINRNAIDKVPPERKDLHALITRTYQNLDVSQQEFADLINQGFAFCAQHKDHHRKNNNFTCAGFTAADIDHGLRLEEAFAHEFVKNYASVVYTTPSHTEQNHRFRVIFETERHITDRQEMRDAYNGVIKKLGGDPSCKDPCRQFWGSKGSNPQVLGNVLPTSVLEELILLGQETRRQYDHKDPGKHTPRSTVRSHLTLELGVEVYDAGGMLHRLSELPPSTPVRCPVHVDRNPSAVTFQTKSGSFGVYCSSCVASYYEASSPVVPEYDFDYGLKRLMVAEPDAYDNIEAEAPHFFDKEGEVIGECRDIQRISERYLPAVKQHAPLVFVKSPKGSGKTQWLESVVRECKNNGESVLLIGHRQSLIQALAKRLGLHPYITIIHTSEGKEDKSVIDYQQPREHFAICVDSLPTLLKPTVHKFDVVLIDEVEQVFRHLTSRTVRDRRIQAFEWFKHYVNAASRLYVLDADLNRLTVETVWEFCNDTDRSVQVVVNEHRGVSRRLELFENRSHLETNFVESLRDGKRCFVCSNSKAGVKRLRTTLEDEFGETRRVLSITSDNSQDAEIQRFILEIQKEILKYDAVIVSPSLGTGVDITFPEDALMIDCVYGFFEARVNTHFDIDQQLSRVRNPRKVKVWISPEIFYFETHPDVVKREVESMHDGARIFIGLNPDGTEQYHKHDGYLNLYANVVALQRGSKNDLRDNFVKMKKYYGWEVVEVAVDEDAAEEGRINASTAKEAVERERCEGLLAAKLITKDEYKVLIGKKARKVTSLSVEEKKAVERYQIESFYLGEIGEDLITEDAHGNLRTKVRNFERFLSPESTIRADEFEIDKEFHTTDRHHYINRNEVFSDLLRSAGVLSGTCSFRTDVVIRVDTLYDFANLCRDRKDEIVTLFDIAVRADVHAKPTQQLSALLGLLGIALKKVATKKEEGRIYEYKVCAQSIEHMKTIVDSRTPEAREQWQRERDATFENRLSTKERPIMVPRTYSMAQEHPFKTSAKVLEWSEVES